MKHFILILLLTVMLCCREKHGTCEQVEKVSFRGLNFQFPIKAYDAMKFSGRSTYYGTVIQTDSIIKNTSARWYTSWYDNEYKTKDTVNYLKDAFVYAVTFHLFGESKRSNEDILKELKKAFPGDYQYIDKYASQYYITRKNCMTVIFRRDAYDEGGVPAISFCYGLSEQEGYYFGHSTGNIWYYD